LAPISHQGIPLQLTVLAAVLKMKAVGEFWEELYG